jgi:hypothetical protein
MNAALRLLAIAGFYSLAWVLACPHPVWAEPTISSLSLRGLQSGSTTKLTIVGAELGPEVRLLLPVPIAEQKLADSPTASSVTFLVTLATDVPSGIYPLRIAGPTGVSAATAIGIDALPQLAFAAQVESLPVALHGNLGGAARMRSSFAGRQGQKIVVEVESSRLGSKLNPVVRLFDANGVQLAWGKATAATGGDARLEATLPADGQYTAELHDALFRGAQPGQFRLKIGDFQFADLFFPIAAQRGSQASAEAVSTNVAPELKFTAPAVGNIAAPLNLPAEVSFSGPRPFVRVSDATEVTEPNSAGGPHAVPAAPVGINGRLNLPHEEDVYRVPVSPGAKLKFELYAARLGSPVDAVLSVRNEQNGQLATNDDRPTTVDPGLDFTVPAGVTALHVAVKDIAGAGGQDFIYRLSIEPADRPAVSIEVAEDRISVPRNGIVLLPVDVARSHFNGPLRLELTDLPAGVTASGVDLAEGVSRAIVSLSAGDVDPLASLGQLAASTKDTANAAVPIRISIGKNPIVPAWLKDRIAIAVVAPSAMRLAWENPPADAQMVAGRKLPLQVKLVRGAGVTGPVRLALVTSQIVPQRTVKKDNKEIREDDPAKAIRLAESPTLTAETATAALSLLVPPDLPKLPYDIAIRAEQLSADGKQVLSSTVTPPLRLLAVEPLPETPLTLLEDEAERVAALDQGTGTAELLADDKYSGTASAKVTGQQRTNPALPGMELKIREYPAAGEYRFLRFAWKKRGGEAIALQLAHDGKLGPESAGKPSYRYHAGPAEMVFGGSLRVNDKVPTEWTVVTRDLFADFGEFTLTGFSLAPIDGEAALFDHLYLGRGPGDFQSVAPAAP